MNEILLSVHEFIKAECDVFPEKKIEAKDLYEACREWLGLTPESFIGPREFYAIVQAIGFKKSKSNKNKVYIFGLDLKSGE